MKKILCLIDTLGMGGAERQMIGLVLLLKARGYEVDLVTYCEHDFHEELVRRYGIGSVTLNVRPNRLSKLLAVRRHIKVSGGYDWVIAFKDGPATIGCLLKLLGLDVNLIVSERNTNQGVSKFDRLKFFLYKWADAVVPNSHSQERFINEHFPDLKEKVFTITNFTDTAHFSPAAPRANEFLRVITAARIASQKNLMNYMEAIRLLKEDGYSDKIKCEWYGDVQLGEEEYAETCLTLLDKLDIGDMFRIFPATTQIVDYYHSCDVFCLPSLYEGFPNVVCEAMSCGKPIACSNVCDNPDIVQNGQNGLLFDPKQPQEIYQALKQMVDMTYEERMQWGQQSRSIAESLFSQDAFVAKYIQLIERV